MLKMLIVALVGLVAGISLSPSTHAADVRSADSTDYVKVTLLNSSHDVAELGSKASGVRFEYIRDGKSARLLGGRDFNFCELRSHGSSLANTANLSLAQMGIVLAGGGTTVLGGAVCVAVGVISGGAALPTPLGAAICGGSVAVGAATFKAVSTIQGKKAMRAQKSVALDPAITDDQNVVTSKKIAEFADLMDGTLKEIQAPVATDTFSKCSERVLVSESKGPAVSVPSASKPAAPHVGSARSAH